MKMREHISLKGHGLNGAEMTISLSVIESIKCPFCHDGIETQPLTFFQSGDKNAEIFLKCKLCKSSFIGYSEQDPRDGCYHINKLSKGNHKTTTFNKEITEVSSQFVKIYGEAEFAENENLNEVCGIGYRKALEFLIKDYLIKKFSDKEDEIKEKSLGKCIGEMIDNSRIKEIAKRATWLGNDETHYFRKWEDKDLVDLKKLIQITGHFISMELEADKYMGGMVDV